MMHVNNETETWKPGDGLGMTLTAAGARRSHRRAVLSCEPLTNIHELHACREYTWPVWRTSTDTSALYRSISVSWQRPQCFLRNPEMAGTFTSCLSVPYPPTVSKSYRTILSNKYTRRQSYNRNTLAVPRKKDLSVKNLCFSSFYHPSLVWSPQKRFCWDLGYESSSEEVLLGLRVRKLVSKNCRVSELPNSETEWSNKHLPSRLSACDRWTEGRTNGTAYASVVL